MSRSIDRRRPRRLTQEQSASVDNNPSYKALASKISQERQRRRYALLKEIKERWEFEQPVRDVEQQLAGLETKDNLELVHEVMLPAQGDLVDSVLSTPGTTIEEEMDRRNRAIRAVTLYCGVEEGGMNPIRRGGRSRNATPPAKSQLEYEEEALEAAKVSVYKEKRPKEMQREAWSSSNQTQDTDRYDDQKSAGLNGKSERVDAKTYQRGGTSRQRIDSLIRHGPANHLKQVAQYRVSQNRVPTLTFLENIAFVSSSTTR
ncbi:DUF3435 domain containing protein [Pyrenophora tritici-repentis]|nr:DUF3435 domain containing protein [Pyrenophora tritici-repentis]